MTTRTLNIFKNSLILYLLKVYISSTKSEVQSIKRTFSSAAAKDITLIDSPKRANKLQRVTLMKSTSFVGTLLIFSWSKCQVVYKMKKIYNVAQQGKHSIHLRKLHPLWCLGHKGQDDSDIFSQRPAVRELTCSGAAYWTVWAATPRASGSSRCWSGCRRGYAAPARSAGCFAARPSASSVPAPACRGHECWTQWDKV